MLALQLNECYSANTAKTENRDTTAAKHLEDRVVANQNMKNHARPMPTTS